MVADLWASLGRLMLVAPRLALSSKAAGKLHTLALRAVDDLVLDRFRESR